MPNKDVPLDFPSKGLHVSREFGQQPEGTVADCLNVTGKESIAGRDRGGSRPGFSKYVAAQSSAGAVKIQMLDVIVDPTTAALPQNFETPDSTWVSHPRFPGVLIPPGGAPWSPIDQSNDTTILHIQSKRTAFDGVGTEQSVSFASAPNTGNTIIAVVASNAGAVSGMGVTVTNGAGTALTQVGSYTEIEDPRSIGTYVRLSMWKKAVNNAQDQTIKVTPSATVVTMKMTQLEYRGMPTTGQVDTAVTNSDITNPPAPPATTGNVAVLGDNEMLLAAFATVFDISGFTPGTGFTCRPNADDGSDFDLRLNVVEKTGLQNPADNPSVATGTTTGGEDPYVAIGVTWKKS